MPTTKLAPPTEDEVLAALAKTTAPTDKHNPLYYRPANRVDVAEAVARSRGWNGNDGFDRLPSGQNPTRVSVVGRWVSVKAVQEILDRLHSEDKAYAFYGSHKLVAGSYGVAPGYVYYLSQEAVDRALAVQRKRWIESTEADALEAASQRVLAEHADDVERYRLANLAAKMTAEPNWNDLLDIDEEAANS